MSESSCLRTQPVFARCFLTLAALSLTLFCNDLFSGGWKAALHFLPGVLIFVGLGWWALVMPASDSDDPGGGRELVGAGAPVPAGFGPRHHLHAGKEFPPSDKTQSWPKD
ncbi:MAG TPA: hypothetical protein VLT36_15415 [Candidatus Dormibacteraeota bacterium]|nr:hypothetical protein [Candidatus Dormibacteraeota bacterium]